VKFVFIRFAIACLLALTSRGALAQEQEDKPETIAMNWCNSLLSGDTAKTMECSGVPFLWDGRTLLKTAAELRSRVDAVVAGKGVREVRATAASRVKRGEHDERTAQQLAVDAWTVHVKIQDETITVYVSPKPPFTVIGFRD